MNQETADCQVSDERGTAHQTATRADCPRGSKWRLFFHALQLHGILHRKLLPASVMARNRLSLACFLFICTGIKGSWQGSWHGGRMYAVLVDIIHSWDGNLEPFYKELWWEGNCFSFHARWKSRLPLKHAESMWSTEKEQYTVQTCTRDFLVLGQAERGTGRAQSSCPVRAQSVFVSDIWAAGCTFGHRSRTAWKERCSKKKRDHTSNPKLRKENLLSGKKSTVLYASGTRDTLYDRLNCVFWIKSCHVTQSTRVGLVNLTWVCLKSQPVHSRIVTFSSGCFHSAAPPTRSCLSSYST